MAANATFALKPGVWFLRVRFVIFAPDSRREPSPPSGRKSTQPTVQILEASSNLVGREAHGSVRIENYRQVLEEVERLARDCSNPATGESAVDFVEYPAPRDPRA